MAANTVFIIILQILDTKREGKIKVGDFNSYQVDLVAKLKEGSTGDSTLKIGFYKEDGTVVYEEVPLVPGEDWKRFSFKPYVEFNYISLEFDPQGDTVYIDDILAGCGYETWVEKSKSYNLFGRLLLLFL